VSDSPLEIRIAPANCELRLIEAEGQPHQIEGLAVPYNALSEDLGGFFERVLPGAFDAALASDADVRVDVEHDPRLILARRAKGTAEFRSTPGGLLVRLRVPDTQAGRDVLENVRVGNQDGFSIAWARAGKRDRFLLEHGRTVRETLEAPLRGVTLTYRPAYRQTADTLVLRSLDEWRKGQEAGPDAEEIARRRRRLELEEADN